MILAGDIGGTRTTLAALDRDLARASMIFESYLSREHADFGEILKLFLHQHPLAIDACCVGVAGPILDNRCAVTNLPWIVDGAEIASRLGLDEVRLLNDLEAVGFGIDVLQPHEILELQAGEPQAKGNRAVIAAGTGLGEAGLFWDGAAHSPFASEGGHGDFAPSDEREIELLRFLLREHKRVSWERVVSGQGLANLYRFLHDSGRFAAGSEPAAIADEMRTGDPAAVISRYAAAGTSPLCARALGLFMKLYGAEAGNLALKMMATGGLYVGGGIAPKNLEWVRNGPFIEAFLAKGRMRPLLEAMPVRLLLNDQTGLLGAARCAHLRWQRSARPAR